MYRDSDDDSNNDLSIDDLDYSLICEYCRNARISKETATYCKFCYKHLVGYIRGGKLDIMGRHCKQCAGQRKHANKWCQDCMIATCADHIHTGKTKCVECRFELCSKFVVDGICERCQQKAINTYNSNVIRPSTHIL